jgi:hypothetical protein
LINFGPRIRTDWRRRHGEPIGGSRVLFRTTDEAWDLLVVWRAVARLQPPFDVLHLGLQWITLVEATARFKLDWPGDEGMDDCSLRARCTGPGPFKKGRHRRQRPGGRHKKRLSGACVCSCVDSWLCPCLYPTQSVPAVVRMRDCWFGTRKPCRRGRYRIDGTRVCLRQGWCL